MAQNDNEDQTLYSQFVNYYLRRLELIKRDLTENVFIIELFVMIATITFIYIYIQNNPKTESNIKLRRITNKAFISFLVAYLAHIDMVTTTFFLIMIVLSFLALNSIASKIVRISRSAFKSKGYFCLRFTDNKKFFISVS